MDVHVERQSEMYGFSWLPSFEHIIRFVESSGKQESQSLSSVVVASRKRELKSREGGVREKQHHASHPIVEMAPHDIVHGIVVEVGDQRLVVELTRWYCIFKDENRLVLPPSGSDVESSHIRVCMFSFSFLFFGFDIEGSKNYGNHSFSLYLCISLSLSQKFVYM